MTWYGQTQRYSPSCCHSFLSPPLIPATCLNLPVSFSTLGLCLLLQRNQHQGNFLGTKLHPLHCCIISILWYSLACGHLHSSETSMGPGPFPQGEGERAKHCEHPQNHAGSLKDAGADAVRMVPSVRGRMDNYSVHLVPLTWA